MRLVIISDTHGWHRDLVLPKGDVLIHCGDMLHGFGRSDVSLYDVDRWFGEQDFELVLCTGGNHDFELEEVLEFVDAPLEHAEVLIDRGLTWRGVRFWGAPWVPGLTWAFHCGGEALERRLERMDPATDVLITHVPPAGILDGTIHGSRSYGSPRLARRVAEVAPRVHCFGHVHEGRGQQVVGETLYVNAAVVGRESPYQLRHAPIVVDLG